MASPWFRELISRIQGVVTLILSILVILAGIVLALKEYEAEEVTDPAVLKQQVRKALSKYLFEATKRKPMILPVVMEV